jgi:hypothetical protein
MASSDPPRRYRVPESLRDLVMIDLLELTGSTTATAELLAMSQPSVSRRYRMMAGDLGLKRQNDAPVGRRFSDTPWVGWLRKGVNHHRLAHGVLRVGGHQDLQPLLGNSPWAHWVPLGRQQQRQWRSLLSLELLDAVAVEELPNLSSEESAQLVLAEVRPWRDGQVVLICRRDPLVLELCSRICGWMELP